LFLDAVVRRNPDLVRLAVQLPQSGHILPNTYVVDLDAVEANARLLAETAQRLKIATLKDLIAYARANPGKLNYGSGGNGSAGHLAGEMFKKAAGIFAVHIPYNGGNPAQLALVLSLIHI